jgi:hypothetical protein
VDEPQAGEIRAHQFCLTRAPLEDAHLQALRAPQGVVRSGSGLHPRGRARVGRDVKAVHGDITARLEAGVLERTPGRGVVVPYEAMKVEFLLRAAAPPSSMPRAAS